MPDQFPLMVPDASPDGELMEVHAPWDGSLIATVERGGPAVAEKALDTAYRLFRDRDGWLSAARRIEILRRTAALMQARREELAMEAAREGGKPLVDSLVEVDRAVDGVHECVEFLRTQHGDEMPMGLNAASTNRLAFTRHEPIGVVVAFSAFNHPLNLIVHQVGPAVATGCPCIVKPAEATPLSAMRFVGILREAGLPEEWCQSLLTTDLDVAGSLATDSRVGFFSFIGSARVGWMLRSKLAPGTRCALEHGGAAPVLVAEDADLDYGLPLISKGGFYHAGQVCVSVQRIFAQRSIARDLAERLAQAATALTVGDPTLLERMLENRLENALSMGATRMDVYLSRETDSCVLHISDNGPGVAVNLREDLFDPNVSGRGSSGLGLALARDIVESHGGSITLLPSAVGAVFRVSLPVSCAR